MSSLYFICLLLAILNWFDWLKSNDGVFMLKGGTNQRHVAMAAFARIDSPVFIQDTSVSFTGSCRCYARE